MKRFLEEHLGGKKDESSCEATKISCAVCHAEYSSTGDGLEQLSCGHGICYRDLLAMIQNGGDKKCPQCREVFNIPAGRLKTINSLFHTVARCYNCELEKKFDDLKWCKDCCEVSYFFDLRATGAAHAAPWAELICFPIVVFSRFSAPVGADLSVSRILSQRPLNF